MTSAISRLQIIGAQVRPNRAAKKAIQIGDRSYEEVVDYEPKLSTKLSYFNKQGWGYNDSRFKLTKVNGKPLVSFTGKRYLYSGQTLPEFFDWAEKNVSLDMNNTQPPQETMEVDPPKVLSHAFMADLDQAKCYSRRSFEDAERTMHSHGASLREVFALRYGRFERYVDLVVYAGTTEHVEQLVALAGKHNVILVPYGGGTNVTQALWLKKDDEVQADRMIVSLDMSRMNKVLWVDKDNMIACV